MKSIIVGMGIGQLYASVLKNMGHEVVTVDLDPAKAEFSDLTLAIAAHKKFDTAHVCTPNFTHAQIAHQLAPHSKIVFVEKPGLESSREWLQMVDKFPKTRFMMVKNNQWRDNICYMVQDATDASHIDLYWVNKNRVPSPGGWFTNKELSWGGVSRDLLPHLLSIYTVIQPNYEQTLWTRYHAFRRWRMQDLLNTDYGSVNPNGIYDVDDRVELYGTVKFKSYGLVADWRSDAVDDISIKFDGQIWRLGLCPESAYQAMIEDCIKNLNNDAFWQNHLRQDLWIHSRISLL